MKLVKIVVILFIITSLTLLPIYQAKAVPTVDPGIIALVTKEYILDLVAKTIAYGILKAVSNSILENIAQIGTGRIIIAGINKGPAFVQNWRNFTLESQYRGEDFWRGLLYIAANGDRTIPPLLCSHIRNSSIFNSLQPTQVDNLIQSGLNRRVNSLEEYLVAAKCDPVVESNYDIFAQDFIQGGGWDTWERLLQPQNNIYGSIELANRELIKQRSIEEKAEIGEVTSADSFTGLRTGCVSVSPLSRRCTILGQIVTPGNILGESIAQTINQNLAFVANADEIDEVIITLIGPIFDRIFSSGGLTQTGNLTEQVLPPQQQPPSVEPSLCASTCAETFPVGPDLDACVAACFGQPPPRNGGGGDSGGGTCAGIDLSADFAGALQSAQSTVVNNNPGRIADLSTTNPNNGRTFLNFVAQELQSAGFNATTNVLNGNGNLNPSGDLIAIWQNGNNTAERYDALIGGRIIRDAIWQNYTGDIPFTCVQ